jgi:hypothetical protein
MGTKAQFVRVSPKGTNENDTLAISQSLFFNRPLRDFGNWVDQFIPRNGISGLLSPVPTGQGPPSCLNLTRMARTGYLLQHHFNESLQLEYLTG